MRVILSRYACFSALKFNFSLSFLFLFLEFWCWFLPKFPIFFPPILRVFLRGFSHMTPECLLEAYPKHRQLPLDVLLNLIHAQSGLLIKRSPQNKLYFPSFFCILFWGGCGALEKRDEARRFSLLAIPPAPTPSSLSLLDSKTREKKIRWGVAAYYGIINQKYLWSSFTSNSYCRQTCC